MTNNAVFWKILGPLTTQHDYRPWEYRWVGLGAALISLGIIESIPSNTVNYEMWSDTGVVYQYAVMVGKK